MVKLRKFQFSDLWVCRHERPSDFHLSSWQPGESAIPLLVYRSVLAAVAIGVLGWSVGESTTPYWLLYLTNWGLVLLAATTLSALLVSILQFTSSRRSDTEELAWYVSTYWLLSNVTVTTAIVITALYWSLLFDGEAETTPRALGLDVSTHALNSAMALSELLVSRTPVKIWHLYQPLGVGLWYAAFTAIYYAAGGTDSNGNPYIYAVLDWRSDAGIVVAASSGGLLAIYVLLWLLAHARDKLSEATVRTIRQDLPIAPPVINNNQRNIV